jgi:hypothetical protein
VQYGKTLSLKGATICVDVGFSQYRFHYVLASFQIFFCGGRGSTPVDWEASQGKGPSLLSVREIGWLCLARSAVQRVLVSLARMNKFGYMNLFGESF